MDGTDVDSDENDWMEETLERQMISTNYAHDLLAELHEQREEGTHCDFIIQVDDKEFNVHRNVIATRSEYFKRMFNTVMKEKREKRVKIQEVSVRNMEKVLNFIYSGEIKLCSRNIEGILHAGSFMQLMDLLNTVQLYIISVLDKDNLWKFRNLALKYNLDGLEEGCHDFLLKNFGTVSKSHDFLNLDHGEVERILCDDIFVTSETFVYEALVRWVKHDLDKRKQYFTKLFELLRLQILPIKYMDEVVMKEDLVQNTQCMKCIAKSFTAGLGFDADNKEPRHGYKPDFEITFLCCNNNSEVAKYKSSSKRFTQVEVSGSTNPEIVVVNRESAYCISQSKYTRHSRYNGKTFTFIESHENSIGEIVSAVVLQDIVYVFCKNGKLHKYDSCMNKWSSIYTNYIPKAGSSPVEFHGKASFIGGFKDEKRTIVTNLVDMFYPENEQTLSGPTLNVERTYCATATYNKSLYVFGGLGVNAVQLCNGEFLNGFDEVWTKLTIDVPHPLGSASACTVGDYIAIYGSSSPGKLAFYSIYTSEWEVIQERTNVCKFKNKGHLIPQIIKP